MSGDHKIFITGASGKIGQLLLDKLLAGGYQPTILYKGDAPLQPIPKVQALNGDLLQPETYAEHLASCQTVLHMAAVTHTNVPGLYDLVNTEGTACLVRAAEAAKVKRFIYISTRAASEQGGGYSRSKLAAEKIVTASALEWIIFRPAEVYGAGGNEGVDMIINSINKFPLVPILGNGSYRVAPVHVSDVITAIVAAVENSTLSGKTYVLAGPEAMSYNRFIDLVLEQKGLRRMKIHIPIPLFRLLALGVTAIKLGKGGLALDQIPRLLCSKSEDIEPAEIDLAFKPLGLKEFLRLPKPSV